MCTTCEQCETLYSYLGVTTGNNPRIPGSQSTIPKLEQGTNLRLSDIVLANLGGLVELLELAEAEEVELRVAAGGGDGGGNVGEGGGGDAVGNAVRGGECGG